MKFDPKFQINSTLLDETTQLHLLLMFCHGRQCPGIDVGGSCVFNVLVVSYRKNCKSPQLKVLYFIEMWHKMLNVGGGKVKCRNLRPIRERPK